MGDSRQDRRAHRPEGSEVNEQYFRTVQLLIAAAPSVFETDAFAMKGGTALNLFVQDMPRLSVDIDLVFTDRTLKRKEALEVISKELQAAKERLEKRGFKADVRTSGTVEAKLSVSNEYAQVKVEVNIVARGSIMAPRLMGLTAAAREQFAADLTLPILDVAELYGGKLAAALDRQHPRDCFDVKLMYERFGLTPQFVDAFVVYLAGHNRPVHEVLFARPKDIAQVYEGEFRGMTVMDVPLQQLLDARARLMQELPRALTSGHREFLLSFVRLEPKWELLQYPDVAQLPAIRWKLENLTALKKKSEQRFQEQATLLAERLDGAT
jgi:hypothetical protein